MKKRAFIYFILMFSFSVNSFPFAMESIENRTIDKDFNDVFSASVELLIKHGWQFRIVDK